MDIVIASGNGYKIREFKSLLKTFPQLDVFSILDIPHYKSPEETGATIEENALIKGQAAALATGKWALADDTALVIPALNGKPGVHSARFASPTATDKENRKKLLEEMAYLVSSVERAAYFECCIVLVSPEGKLYSSVYGSCEGEIIDREKGCSGFGYDPLFLKYDYNMTFGELNEEIKNRISHRAKALKQLNAKLESLIKSKGF
ncbi:Non-canonical purine NTP pyrophosphatase [Candidatus Clavichlamydia salmonicola]|uniref:RdgB/HAM1 family non-canonical purine NTP pyrophosphatase n=1 Tax=Candidatus Clavichlamydia salmonicola TaxID=469812 RepID=UPI0018919C26|nr:RdgB/HAM1 family non-canonical purine NTP pyrophosphatase [Candidatus Clavichlamydia salmonicola]MBF5050608.1 Non-canonical purine NTP pyrophosphatase [Candidatus Clavichlamydia salmonicola]